MKRAVALIKFCFCLFLSFLFSELQCTDKLPVQLLLNICYFKNNNRVSFQGKEVNLCNAHSTEDEQVAY